MDNRSRSDDDADEGNFEKHAGLVVSLGAIGAQYSSLSACEGGLEKAEGNGNARESQIPNWSRFGGLSPGVPEMVFFALCTRNVEETSALR